MENRIILLYLVILSAILILLRVLGVAHFNNDELISYILIIYGLGLYYSSYLKNMKTGLFLGSAMFLSGIVFLVIGNFEFMDTNQLVLPSIIMITAISIFMLYLNDQTNKLTLYLSIALFAFGVFYIGFTSEHGYYNLIPYLLQMIKLYWIVIVMLIVVAVLVNREIKN